MSDAAALAALYPSAQPASAVPAGQATHPPAVGTEPTAAAAPQPSQPAPNTERDDPDAFARRLYGDGAVPTREPVRWGEPAARDGSEICFTLPLGDHVDHSEAGDAERKQLAEALAHAGSGQSLASELYRDAAAAARPGYAAVDPQAGIASLREAWGAGFDANLAAARALVGKAASKDPSIVPFLERTGLGNDPAFIRKIAARAAKLRAK